MRRGSALGELAIIEDGSVLIRNGLIEQVGSTRRLENLKEAREAQEVDATGTVVMPAFVDPSIRLPVKLSGGSQRKRSGEFAENSISLLRACLQHGTLHGQVKIGAPQAASHLTLSLLREFARNDKLPFRPLVTWMVDEPMPFSPAERGGEMAADLVRIYHSGLAQSVCVSPESHAAVREQVWSEAVARRIPISLIWSSGMATTVNELLRRVRPQAIFCSCTSPDFESGLLASIGVPLICSPIGPLDELPPSSALPHWVEAGVPFALTTGFGESEWEVFNVQMVISLAVLRFGLTVEQAISAVTVNAASSIGAGLQTGTLEVGKNADVLLLQIDDFRDLRRRYGGNLVRLAMRAGKIVFRA